MTLFWGSSYGFPTPLPTGRFKDYIRRHEIVASHFYSAYPDATTTMVLSALELDAKLRDFRKRTTGHGPRGLRARLARIRDRRRRGTCEHAIPTARARPARSPSSRRSRPAPSRRCARTWRGCARAPARWPAWRARTSAAGSSSPTSCPTTSPSPTAWPGRTCCSRRASTAPLDTYLDELCDELAAEAQEIWGRCVGGAAATRRRAAEGLPARPPPDDRLLRRRLPGGHGRAGPRGARPQREDVIAFARDAQGMDPAQLQAAFRERLGG